MRKVPVVPIIILSVIAAVFIYPLNRPYPNNQVSFADRMAISARFTLATIGDLKALPVDALRDGQACVVLGYHTAGDGGGGTFRWDASSSMAGNGGTIFATSAANGRWIRQFSAMVNVKWFGAYGNGATDDVAALQAAFDYCAENRTIALIPDGTFVHTATLKAACPIRGHSPLTSVLHHTGAGDALNLNAATYYSTFSNFAVSGTTSGRDGITLVNPDDAFGAGDPNASYCQFFNVHSYSHGRHGIHHRMAWATKYTQVKSYDNGALGFYFDTQVGDLGTANGVSCIQCESRHNGQGNTGFGSMAGGVQVSGCASFLWLGGTVESNGAFGFYIGGAPGSQATRSVEIRNVYLEGNGFSAAVGGAFYITGPWMNVSINHCQIAYGADAGNTNYCFNVGASSDGGGFAQEHNVFTTVGAGASVRFYGTAFEADIKTIDTQPSFAAVMTGSVDIPNAIATKLPVNSVNWDTNNNYDYANNHRFQPTVPGYYLINGGFSYFDTKSTNTIAYLYLNGGLWRSGNSGAGSANGSHVTALVYLNGTTDYVELFGYQASGGTVTYTPALGHCYFDGVKVK